MNFKSFVGIDISKDKLDFAVCTETGTISTFLVENDEQAIALAFKDIFQNKALLKESTLFCAEITGHFGNKLIRIALQQEIQLWYESPNKISKSQGLQRGKNDTIDALRILQYAKRFVDLAQPIKAVSSTLEHLKYLMTERDLIVRDKGKYEGQIMQEEGFLNKNYLADKKKRSKRLIAVLSKSIMEIEKQIDKLIENDCLLKMNFDSLVSIPGIGKQTALATIVATGNFTKFENARQFICHAGCAPFKYFSGTSIRSGNHVSQKANKAIKRLLHMAALSAIQRKGEFKDYYLRKVNAGKNKMSAINAVRAKLITRMFAVIREERKYENIYTPALA